MGTLRFTAAGDDAASTVVSGTPRRRRLPEWVGNMVVAGLALAVGLGLGEGMVRLLTPQQLILKRPDIWRAVDTVGWAARPDLNTTINTGERTVRLITDRDGFRVGQAGRVDGQKRILLLGDSFMEALQVEYEQSLAGLLEARLPRLLNAPVAVRNTGVGSWDPPQYLLAARRMLVRERFDLVLVAVYLANDVVPRRIDHFPPRAPVQVHRLRLPRGLSYGEFINAVLYPINDFLEVRSHLFILLKTQLNAVLTRFGLTAEEFPVDLLRREAGSPRWAVTAEILRDIRDVARTHGVPALFVLIPAPYQVDVVEFQRALRGFRIDPAEVDLDQPNRLLTATMQVHQLDVFDALPEFRRAQRAGQRLYGKVDRHFGPAGHALLERLIEPLVVAHLPAPRLLSPPGVSAR